MDTKLALRMYNMHPHFFLKNLGKTVSIIHGTVPCMKSYLINAIEHKYWIRVLLFFC